MLFCKLCVYSNPLDVLHSPVICFLFLSSLIVFTFEYTPHSYLDEVLRAFVILTFVLCEVVGRLFVLLDPTSEEMFMASLDVEDTGTTCSEAVEMLSGRVPPHEEVDRGSDEEVVGSLKAIRLVGVEPKPNVPEPKVRFFELVLVNIDFDAV